MHRPSFFTKASVTFSIANFPVGLPEGLRWVFWPWTYSNAQTVLKLRVLAMVYITHLFILFSCIWLKTFAILHGEHHCGFKTWRISHIVSRQGWPHFLWMNEADVFMMGWLGNDRKLLQYIHYTQHRCMGAFVLLSFKRHHDVFRLTIYPFKRQCRFY